MAKSYLCGPCTSVRGAGRTPRTAECALETASNSYEPCDNSNSCLDYLLQEVPVDRWSRVAVFPVSEVQRGRDDGAADNALAISGLALQGFTLCWPNCSSEAQAHPCHPQHTVRAVAPSSLFGATEKESTHSLV